MPQDGGTGKPKSFCVPCEMKLRAVKIRSSARA